MCNYIINENYYDTLYSYHQNDKNIRMYFGEEFKLNDKFLQKATIFKDKAPDLKTPKTNMLSNILYKETHDLKNTEFDFDNAVVLYETMQINPVQACDHRLWSYLCHGPYYNFIKKRYKPNKRNKDYEVEKFYEYNEEIQTTVRNFLTNRFFNTTDNRTLRRNGVAFLWWAVELTHSPWNRWNNIEKRSNDKYYYTRVVLKDTDIYLNTFERTIGKEPRIVFPLLDAIIENKLTRLQYRSMIKKINSDVHLYHYSVMKYKEVRVKIDTLLQTII